MKAYPECNVDRVKTYPDCNDDGVVDKDTDDEGQCPTFGGVGFVPDDDDYEEVIKMSRVALSVTKHQKQTMKSILGVSLLILLMPSAYAVALPGDSADGKRTRASARRRLRLLSHASPAKRVGQLENISKWRFQNFRQRSRLTWSRVACQECR